MKIILSILRVLLAIAIFSLAVSVILFIPEGIFSETTVRNYPFYILFGSPDIIYFFLSGYLKYYLGWDINVFPSKCGQYWCEENIGNQMIFYGIATLVIFVIYKICKYTYNRFGISKSQNIDISKYNRL